MCPVLPRLVHRTALYDAAWAAGPPPNRCSLHFAMDDGILRQMELEPQHYVRDAANTVISMSAGGWKASPARGVQGGFKGGCGAGRLGAVTRTRMHTRIHAHTGTHARTHVRTHAHVPHGPGAGYDPSCTWSLSYSPITACLAFGGDDGIVALSTVEACSEVRARQPHVPIGGMVR